MFVAPGASVVAWRGLKVTRKNQAENFLPIDVFLLCLLKPLKSLESRWPIEYLSIIPVAREVLQYIFAATTI